MKHSIVTVKTNCDSIKVLKQVDAKFKSIVNNRDTHRIFGVIATLFVSAPLKCLSSDVNLKFI